MLVYQKRPANATMTWIDVASDDSPAISRQDYEGLVALTTTAADGEHGAFVITLPALERILHSIAIGLIHSGQ